MHALQKANWFAMHLMLMCVASLQLQAHLNGVYNFQRKPSFGFTACMPRPRLALRTSGASGSSTFGLLQLPLIQIVYVMLCICLQCTGMEAITHSSKLVIGLPEADNILMHS
jgi:hypothetical protein